jgi:metal-dependent HD superfamily phosphatase/phosphodiesterase
VFLDVERSIPRKRSNAPGAQMVEKMVEKIVSVVTPKPNIVQLRKQVLKIIDELHP